MSLFAFRSLDQAYRSCRKRKRGTINALKFEQNLLDQLCDLEGELENRSYRPGRSICFLTGSPKLREVFAADFRDRVVHHLLVPHLERIFEPTFIHDVHSNRTGRGIHSAMRRARKFARRHRCGHYLQLDIKSFFYSIDKAILECFLIEGLRNSSHHTPFEITQLLWLTQTILHHDPTQNFLFKGNPERLQELKRDKSLFHAPKGIGLPIGNLTSQFFANVMLNGFDNWIKRVFKVKSYLRYVDDFVLFHDDKAQLQAWEKEIESYLRDQLHLTLKKRRILHPCSEGLDFVGYVIRPDYVLVRQRVVNHYKRKKARYLEQYEQMQGKMELEEIKRFLSVQASFLGHIRHANAHCLKTTIGALHETNPFSFDLRQPATG